MSIRDIGSYKVPPSPQAGVPLQPSSSCVCLKPWGLSILWGFQFSWMTVLFTRKFYYKVQHSGRFHDIQRESGIPNYLLKTKQKQWAPVISMGLVCELKSQEKMLRHIESTQILMSPGPASWGGGGAGCRKELRISSNFKLVHWFPSSNKTT